MIKLSWVRNPTQHNTEQREEKRLIRVRTMEATSRRNWFFLHLRCFLVGSLVDSTVTQTIFSKVGSQVVLPCSWKSRLGEVAPSACHVQWTTLSDTVFERWEEQKWQAEEFKGRVEVPKEGLGSGNCSLIIRDVQVGDTGRYESFMVVDGERSKKTRVFIQSVKLSVLDHKSLQSRRPGEDLVLDLYTRHAVRVVFQDRNSSRWSELWMRGDEDSQRLEKHPLRDQVTIKRLKSSDGGTYKVLDGQGLAVSTVQLSVEESSVALKVQRLQEDQVPTGDAARSSCSALLIPSVLVLLLLSCSL